METIIATSITAAVTLIVCLINNIAQSKKIRDENNAQNERMLAEIKSHNEIQQIQIKELTKQVEKHNRVIERVYKLEQFEEVEKEQIKVINHRIHDLEEYHK